MALMQFYKVIEVTDEHTIGDIESIVKSMLKPMLKPNKPIVIALKSEKQSLNNKVIDYTIHLIERGWKWDKEYTKITTKWLPSRFKQKKVKNNLISFTLRLQNPESSENSLSCDDLKNLREIKVK